MPATAADEANSPDLFQVTAGVDLDHVHLARLRQAHVDPAVIAHAQGAVGVHGRLLELGAHLVRDFGHNGFRALVLSTFLIPFRLGIKHVRLAVGHRRKVHFDGRKRLRFRVAQNADIKFTAFNVFFHQRGVVNSLVYVADAVDHLGGAVDERFGVDADGGVHAQRLDEQRQTQAAGRLQRGVLREHGEFRVAHAVEGEQLLGQRLVLLDVELAGAATGVRQTHQVEEADDADGAELVVAERLHEVENEVGLSPFQPGRQLSNVAVDAEDGNLVLALFQGLGDLIHHDVIFRVAFVFEIRQDGDIHGASRERGSGSGHAGFDCKYNAARRGSSFPRSAWERKSGRSASRLETAGEGVRTRRRASPPGVPTQSVGTRIQTKIRLRYSDRRVASAVRLR